MPHLRLLCLLALTASLHAAPPKGSDMDYGPFLFYSVLRPQPPQAATTKKAPRKTGDPTPAWKAGDLLAAKGITVRLPHGAAICFDTDTCRYAGGWTGGWLDVTRCNLAHVQGPLPAIAAGTLTYTTTDGPGWAKADSFTDPRPRNSDRRVAGGEGPLPRDWAHYRGVYRDGERIVFAYTVGNAEILDTPGAIEHDGEILLTRTIRLDRNVGPLVLRVADDPAVDLCLSEKREQAAALQLGPTVSIVGLTHDDTAKGIEIRPTGKTAIDVHIPRTALPLQFTLVATVRPTSQIADGIRLIHDLKVPQDDIHIHTHGGPPVWSKTVEGSGAVAPDKAAYVVDTAPLPIDNPWKSWIKPGGFDFLADGRCALCTMNGDVWLSSPLTGDLAKISWHRIAAGLYEPLGLRVVDGKIHVLGRDGIHILHDLNNDGEADFIENFNSDAVCDANYHSFHYDLQTDREGNFYYAVTGNQTPYGKPHTGCVIKVSKYGDKLEVVATGLRAANGMGAGPNDEITVSDNQGYWVPASPIFMVKPGDFYGYHGDPRKVTKDEIALDLKQHPHDNPPLCWIPYKWDNSSGGEVWAGANFGPLSNHMFHLSYGKAEIFEMLGEKIGDVWQGAAVPLGLKFDSGVMRGRVNPADGSLWVAGLRGWQTSAAKDGCLQRIRYTGRPFNQPIDLHVTPGGLSLTFPAPLDPATAKDPGSYSFEAWTYQRTEKYGSDDYKASNPQEKGRDTLDVTSADLSPDGKTLTLKIAGLKPVTQYLLTGRLNTADGSAVKLNAAGTINVLPTAQ